ncbi:DNA ligase (plasmid) [Alicyclobacillus acidoterrestris]|uniref:ATP-dependent DNA ligase n=1 Tax=Alicyclobacillus acidoterrestris TaxID=1450 RepID=UPI003F52FA08
MLFSPIRPMLLTQRTDAFDDENYIFQPKWDGWRILLHKQGGHIRAFTRTGRDVTAKFPELDEVNRHIDASTAILDCEGVCIRNGRSVFDDFQYRGRLSDRRKIELAAGSHPVTFVAFDVLYRSDKQLLLEPLHRRNQVLEKMIEPCNVITPTFSTEGNGVALKQETERLRWEGIVAKKRDSQYRLNERSSKWLKIKNWQEIDCVILGYRLAPTFGLIVGLNFKTVENKPVAVVEWGMKPEEKRAFLQVSKQIRTHETQGTQWIEPRLCCRIKYLDRTEKHHLRHAVFLHFAFEKEPEECRWTS